MPAGKQTKELTSTPGEWFVIIQTSRILDNDLLVELTDEDLQNMQYHDRTYYPVASVLVKVKNQLKYETKQNTESSIVSELSSVESKHKRRKTHTESDCKEKTLHHLLWVNCKRSNKRFRIEDTKLTVS